MSTTLHVAEPWAWSWCPLAALPITESPDLEDGRTRTYGHPAPGWTEVARAVIAAVSTAQTQLTSDLIKWADVEVPSTLDAPTARVAQSWLGLGEGVTWSLVDQPRIGDGRHRLWACRHVSGIAALPLRLDTVAALPDALIDYGDEAYRTSMAAAVLSDLAGVETTLGARSELSEINPVMARNLVLAQTMLRDGTALMTEDQWSAANT